MPPNSACPRRSTEKKAVSGRCSKRRLKSCTELHNGFRTGFRDRCGNSDRNKNIFKKESHHVRRKSQSEGGDGRRQAQRVFHRPYERHHDEGQDRLRDGRFRVASGLRPCAVRTAEVLHRRPADLDRKRPHHVRRCESLGRHQRPALGPHHRRREAEGRRPLPPLAQDLRDPGRARRGPHVRPDPRHVRDRQLYLGNGHLHPVRNALYLHQHSVRLARDGHHLRRQGTLLTLGVPLHRLHLRRHACNGACQLLLCDP